MDEQLANAILDQLKNGEIKEYVATKDVFYTFRKVVVSREDFKHIIGNAQRMDRSFIHIQKRHVRN